jgi:predicted HAD superfamily Cof-like phosphohydrolase
MTIEELKKEKYWAIYIKSSVEERVKLYQKMEDAINQLKEQLEGTLVDQCRKAESPAMIQAICAGALVKALEKVVDKAMPEDLANQVNLFKMVAQFNEKFGLAYAGGPRELPPALRKLKETHLHEELVEYKKALAAGDLEECLDALIDLIYVALGTAYLHGFDFNEGFRRVHAANMTKERARAKYQSKRNSEYDIIKPDGWKPAKLSDLVE